MAIHWSTPLALLVSLAIVQARPPSLYWPSSGDPHTVQTRTHLDDTALTGLNENELETLLYLLDKVDRPRVVPSQQQQEHYAYAHPYYDNRNKRTGHHGDSIHAASKKAVDWSDYFGIDKREVKVTENEEVKVTDLENGKFNKVNDLEAVTTAAAATPVPDAKTDKEREEILKEFYTNMAMAANVRRKRAVRSHSIDKDMSKVGDNLIWDAVKLTGAHRDEKLSKDEFKQLKKELIRRIGTAYDLEKLRHVLEGGNLLKFATKGKTGQ